MSSFNKVIMVGNLVTDPETRELQQGNSVTKFRIASNRSYKTKGGEKKEDATFIDCEMWGPRGQVLVQYAKKGNSLLVEGYLKQENWESKDGEKRSKLLISVDNFEFFGGKREDGDKVNTNASSATPRASQTKSKNSNKEELSDIPF